MVFRQVWVAVLLTAQVVFAGGAQTEDSKAGSSNGDASSLGFVRFSSNVQISKSKYTPVVKDLWLRLEEADDQSREKISNELADTIAELNKKNNFDEALSNAKLLYSKTKVARARRIAFGVMSRLDPTHVAQVSRKVVFEIPSVTCHGRLLDAINERFRDHNEWVLNVKLEGTQRKANAMDWGTIAVLTVAVEKQKTDRQVIQAMKDAVLGIESWAIRKAIPISEL